MTPGGRDSRRAARSFSGVSWVARRLPRRSVAALGDIQVHDGTFLDVEDFLVAIDVVRAADRHEAIELAATHPLAGYFAIEVRPCWSSTAPDGPESQA